ncbi:hypothetical protein KAR02_13755 [Candidatus Bipolaricaulota bacterium]|nr:hypothetical protein [Candidatus Bipolaricaulota bacterium]
MELFYHLLMNWQQVWGVLKWVLAALVAGFVGQFGKSLALFFMKRRRNRKGVEAASNPVGASRKAPPSVPNAKDALGSNQAKLEKKRAKAEVKRLKKS